MKFPARPATSLTATLLLLAAFLAGCGSPSVVTVDALRANEPLPGKEFLLVSDMDEIASDDLFFQEVAARVQTSLRKAGFTPLNDSDAASPDLRIGLKAFLSDPLTETRSRSEPIYRETSGTRHVIATPVMDSKGNVVRFVYSSVWSHPRTELAGYTRSNEQITVYDKILRLSARHPDSGRELWTVSARLRSRSTDFRAALPVLLKAAQPYYGERTEGEVRIEINIDSDEFKAYQQSLSRG